MINPDFSIVPGVRVLAYHYTRNETLPAVVIRRYGFRSTVVKYMCGDREGQGCIYPDCLDLLFDCDDRISNGHFAHGAVRLPVQKLPPDFQPDLLAAEDHAS